MSKREVSPVPVIEWSPTSVRVFVPGSSASLSGPSLAAVRQSIPGDEVVVAISRRSSFLRTARLPDAPKKDVTKILQLQVSQLFPLTPTDAAVDFYLADDRNSEGRLAVVAAVKAETLSFLQDELVANGLKSTAVVPAALGSSLLAKNLGRKECAIVEAVPEGLAIDIVSEGELRLSRVVPMPPTADLIDGEVTRSYAIAKIPCAESVAVGGIEYPEMNAKVEKSGLYTLMEGAMPLTLESPEVVMKREVGRVAGARKIAMLLWVSAILLAFAIFDIRSTDTERVMKVIKKRQDTVNSLKKTHDQGTTKLNSLRKVDTALDLAFEPKQQLGDVASLFSVLAPQGLWLTGMSLERGKLATVRGTATTGEAVTKYLEILSAQPRFRDCKLVIASNGTIEKVSVVQFSISAHIVGNFPLDTEDAK